MIRKNLNRLITKWTYVLLFVLLNIQPVFSQFKNILLDDGSGSKRAPSEPSIAISYKNPDVMVAGSILNNVYYTSNGGITWTKSRMRCPYGVYGDPVIISDFKGDFYYFHLSDPTGKNWESEEFLDRIVGQQSKDGGKVWDAGASIGFNHPKDQDKEWAVADRKGNIYVAWTEFDKYGSNDPGCKTNIQFSKSTNGTKYTKPIQISQAQGDCKDDDNTAMGAVPAVSNDGKVFITWANKGIIYLDRSFDGGDTWLTSDIPVAEQPGGWSMSIPGLDRGNGLPVLACDQTKSQYSGALYLMWADQRNGEGDTDIWFARSFNYGDNWAEAIRINDDGKGKHQFLPWMTVDPVTGYIYILFYDRRNYEDNQTDVFLAYSTDNGVNFKNLKISNSPFTPTADNFFGDYTNIAAHNGVIAAIWARMDEGKTSVWTTVFKHADLEAGK